MFLPVVVRYSQKRIIPTDGLAIPRIKISMRTRHENSSSTVFAISDGRLRRLWDVPDGYRIFRLELSEDESHAAVQLHGDARRQKTIASIELGSGRVSAQADSTGQRANVFLTGVTNQGDLVLEDNNGSALFVSRVSQDPREGARFIRKKGILENGSRKCDGESVG